MFVPCLRKLSLRSLVVHYIDLGKSIRYGSRKLGSYSLAISHKNVRNPNHHYFSKKYRNTPPICIAILLQFVLQCFWCPFALRKGKYCQYSSHLYRSTPPICIAVVLYASHLYRSTPPICIAVLLGKSWWLWSPECSPIS